MAYYPAQDILIVAEKTEAEMEASVATAMAQGYFPVDDNSVWNGRLVAPTEAYRQAMIKYQNTDPQFIAAMYAAFKPALDDIRAHLDSIDSKLDTISSIDSKLNTANTHLNNIETNTR